MNTHADRIRDQFTKQATLFQESHRNAAAAIETALSVSGVAAGDHVLDVACGPGVLSCAFAKIATHVTGIDITPTMLEQAKELQAVSHLDNLTWNVCDVYDMPFEDASFSMIISRYAFHHIERPKHVLREMVRVCKPGGRIVVIDSAPPPEKEARFNAVEKMRDPSHTRALMPDEVANWMTDHGLHVIRRHLYAWEVTAESLLARSFPADGDRAGLFRLYAGDVGVDHLAMNSRYIGGVLHVTFPTLVSVGCK